MKKIISILCITITFLVIFFLQANFFTWFNIAGIMPNLFVIFAIWIGLFVGNKLGLALGLIFGIYLDLLINKSIGISGIMLGAIGIIAEYLDNNFSKDSRITIMLIVAGGTAIFEIGIYIFNIIRWGSPIEILPFLKILIIEIIFNELLTIILYPLIQKTGYKLETIFKNKSKAILTRYY